MSAASTEQAKSRVDWQGNMDLQSIIKKAVGEAVKECFIETKIKRRKGQLTLMSYFSE